MENSCLFTIQSIYILHVRANFCKVLIYSQNTFKNTLSIIEIEFYYSVNYDLRFFSLCRNNLKHCA